MTNIQKLHTLMAEALRSLEDQQYTAVRRKISYADVLLHELESPADPSPADQNPETPTPPLHQPDGEPICYALATGEAVITPEQSARIRSALDGYQEALHRPFGDWKP